MSLVIELVLALLCCYALLLVFMYVRQESFIFYPTRARHEDHREAGVVDYRLDRAGITLRGWLVNPGYAREKLLIYYGGNAEDVFLNIDDYRGIQAATLFVAYRGYGPSGGRPGEAELFGDALAVFDDMRSRHDPDRVFVIGRSLGSGVACYVASRRDVQGAILVTPFDSIENLAGAHYPWLPVSLLLRHRFASIEYVQDIRCPLLVIYGGRDLVVRPVRTANLIARIRGEKEVVFISAAEHGTVDMYPAYWEAILRFIDRQGIVPPAGSP